MLREVIIQRVPEDTPITVRKSKEAKKKYYYERLFLQRQEKLFLKIAGNITFSYAEWWDISKRGYGMNSLRVAPALNDW
jgi:hypothetical protein